VIRIDLHCHLEVTVAQQGHFGIKSTIAQKETVRDKAKIIIEY